MKELAGHAVNFFIVPTEDKRPLPMCELILLMSEPRYVYEAAGFAKRRELTDVRVGASAKQLRDLAASFIEHADSLDGMEIGDSE